MCFKQASQRWTGYELGSPCCIMDWIFLNLSEMTLNCAYKVTVLRQRFYTC